MIINLSDIDISIMLGYKETLPHLTTSNVNISLQQNSVRGQYSCQKSKIPSVIKCNLLSDFY